TNKEASTLADLAKQQGIPIISITQDEKSVIGEKSDIVLQTSSGEDVPLRSAATVSLVAQLYVVDVLFFAYAAKNYKETLEKIQISRKNVERLKE
ncbi:SIS domain-containing protein, partial [Enterococcus faecalis]